MTGSGSARAAIQLSPSSRRFAQRWYLTVESHLRALNAPAWAGDVRERAKPRSLLPTDTEELFERGVRAEFAGALEGPLSRSQVVSRNRVLHPDVTRNLLAAARHYESVVRADPGFLGAWLHLGRVRMILSQDDGAISALTFASRAPERHVAYLARLFRGAVAERRQQFAEAEGHYREAVALFRWGQSGPLALAQLLGRTGREADARGVRTARCLCLADVGRRLTGASRGSRPGGP